MSEIMQSEVTDLDEIDQLEALLSPTEDEKIIVLPDNDSWNNRKILSVIALQIAIVILLFAIAREYGRYHNVPHPFSLILNENINYEGISTFDFLGVSPDHPQPSFLAVIFEAFCWSYIGVSARSEYYLTQIVIRRKRFNIYESISKIIGDTAMGIAIAVAVIAFLRTTEFLSISLKEAGIGSIVAISFILGFYHEDARRLLGSLQQKITSTSKRVEDTEKDEKFS